MFDIQTLIMFTTTSVLLGLAPGPDNIFVLTQSMLNGRKAGFFVTLGLCTGLIFHTLAVALGVAVIFQTSALAFAALKFVGAGYLLYLAVQAFRAGNTEISQGQKSDISLFSLYKKGVFMNITNPKVSIFFLAFLPQFTDPGNGALPLQMVTLGFIFMLTTVVVFGSVSQLAGMIGTWFSKSRKAGIILNRTAGTVFAGLAVKLAFAER
ncbi:MAG: LysE family translocator [Desulfobacterales bacterium]|nr:LysE family translocator [Desulfobacterales bacterium]